MPRLRTWAIIVLIAGIGVTTAFVVKKRMAAPRAAVAPDRAPLEPEELRRRMYTELQPVALANCTLERFGEPHDGGYLMCGNLLDSVRSGYSYGIAGYDQWGCDISKRIRARVHQYDCFNLTEPVCSDGDTVFHAECIAGERRTDEQGRLFDTLESQVASNGDAGGRLVVKMDVEGAEWDSLLRTPDAVFESINQMAVEFHGFPGEPRRPLEVVERLKQFFYVAHVHFNNFSCREGYEPFPVWAYEVLFVNKRLATVDPAGQVLRPHPLDAPNDPTAPDCAEIRQ